FNSTFGEFGIFINSNITVYGTPEAYGQPGESNIKMIGMSMLSYSANAVYWVNISCPDPQRKDGSGSIPISNLAVRLVHPNADGSNSEIAEEPTHFTGADIPMLVWNGNSMMPLGNGTWSSGPFLSDYNSPDNYSSYIEWWVDIPEGTSIGVYDWVITMTIECDSYKHEYPLYVNGIHVEDTSPPESNITEVIKASDHWTINAEANDNHSSVTEVVLMYRYSEDNVNWRSWTVYETDPTAPWSWDFDMLKHDGYYEFLSVAKDEYDNVEDAGLIADISETNGLGLDIYLIITIVIAVSIVAIVMVKLRKRKKE
ncbi:MAG: hypothetical protein KAS16_05120, partial [Thermoplasmata archaeon]|nr:hypothetical protein [Thermoplasmata archaeon]